MAAAHESQGLKIAVVALITLNVILTVACYFLYSAYAASEARRVAAEAMVRARATAPPANAR
jgi:hypothetical protein